MTTLVHSFIRNIIQKVTIVTLNMTLNIIFNVVLEEVGLSGNYSDLVVFQYNMVIRENAILGVS